jgi:RNA polymerase sigma-70 factor (ECF subfamily)
MFSSEPNRWRDLAIRLQAHDPGAEDELVKIFYPHVMAMALSRLRDLETAREAAQDTFLGVLQALREGRLREAEKLPAFVSGIARNLINNRLQELIRRRGSVSLNEDIDPSGVRHDDVVATGLEEEERRALVVRTAMHKLKPGDYRILMLTLAKGLNPREIALELGLKPEAVRNHKSRALKTIQREVRKAIRKRGSWDK